MEKNAMRQLYRGDPPCSGKNGTRRIPVYVPAVVAAGVVMCVL